MLKCRFVATTDSELCVVSHILVLYRIAVLLPFKKCWQFMTVVILTPQGESASSVS